MKDVPRVRTVLQLQSLGYRNITVFLPDQSNHTSVFHNDPDLGANLTNMVFRIAVHVVTKDYWPTKVHNQLLLLVALSI